MIEPISGDLRSALSGVLAEAPQGPARTIASKIEDQLRFEEAMATPPAAVDGVEPAQTRVAVGLEGGDQWVLPQGTLTPAVPPAPTMGDRILNGMDSLRNGWSGIESAVNEAVNANEFDPVDMMRLQFEFGQGMFVLTLVGNEAAAIPKKIDGLLKTA